MPNIRMPRSGSMQFWPRKRAQRPVARIRSWAKLDKAQLLGFAGYKVGMTNISIVDGRKKSPTKGTKINEAVTIIECPPIKISSIRLYKDGLVVKELLGKDKDLAKKLVMPKKDVKLDDIKSEGADFDEVRVNVSTQPKMTGFGKKKPEFFEMALGGNKDDALSYAKENFGKEISIGDVFESGSYVDIHAITTGKGYQGPVKRFGIGLKGHKNEKGRRLPGARSGGWKAQGHMMHRVAQAGKMGFHMRTEYNKQILSIEKNPETVNPKGGFPGYGVVKGTSILVRGSVAGPSKRLIRFNMPIRNKNEIVQPNVVSISTESKQR